MEQVLVASRGVNLSIWVGHIMRRPLPFGPWDWVCRP